MRLAVIDGEVRTGSAASISVFDRCVLLGDAVFETLRVRGNAILDVDLHLDRLERSAETLGIVLPCSRADLASEVVLGVRAAGHTESAVRILVTRGEGGHGLDPSGADAPRRFVLVDAYRPVEPARLRDGLALRTSRTVRTPDLLPYVKLPGYATSILATRAARAAGDDEALLVDETGFVLEGTTFNVFAVLGGVLVTPPVGSGVLDGTTRRVVLALAREHGLAAEETLLPLESLRGASEAFVTSTLRELVPVARVDGGRLGRVPGPVTRRLHEAYRRRIEAPPPPYDPLNST